MSSAEKLLRALEAPLEALKSRSAGASASNIEALRERIEALRGFSTLPASLGAVNRLHTLRFYQILSDILRLYKEQVFPLLIEAEKTRLRAASDLLRMDDAGVQKRKPE